MASFNRNLFWIFCLFLIGLNTSSAATLNDLLKACPDGSFGYVCRFRCRCRGNDVCDKVTGSCSRGCAPGYWGPGCQLVERCFYNSQSRNYMGQRSMTEENVPCQRWSSQIPHSHRYEASNFPDRKLPDNFCRTTTDASRPWCYTTNKDKRWSFCDVTNCACPRGRFGQNCNKDCHCKNPDEPCDSITGVCNKSNCAIGWTGHDCQTPTLCPANRYGWVCSKKCHCKSFRDCDRFMGPKRSCECETGYFNPPFCEPVTAPRILYFGNEKVNPGQDSTFNCTVAAFPTPYEREIQLKGPPGKPITLIRSSVLDRYMYTRMNLFHVPEVASGERFSCNIMGKAGRTAMTIGADVFELPMLRNPPILDDNGIQKDNITIEWSVWKKENGDLGDPPILWYNVYVRANQESISRVTGTVFHTFCGDVCRFTIPNLEPNKEYAIYIVTRREGEKGEGPPGPVLHARTKCAAPTDKAVIDEIIPSFQINSSVPKTQLTIKWMDAIRGSWNCNRISSYMLFITNPEENDKSPRVVHLPGTSEKKVTVADLEPETRYCVKLRYKTDEGFESPDSEEMCLKTPTTEPPTPRFLKVTNKTATSITFAWNAPMSARGYYAVYHILFWDEKSSTVKNSEVISEKRWVTRTLNGLEPFTKYNIRVQTITDAGPGPESETLVVVTAETAPGPVRNFKNVTRTTNSLELQWHAPERLNGEIQFYTISCDPKRSLFTGRELGPRREVSLSFDRMDYTFLDLSPATEYSCKINARTTKGAGPDRELSAWTEPADPITPVKPSVTKTSEASITLDLSSNGDSMVSFYRVIVERLTSTSKKRSIPDDIRQIEEGFQKARIQGKRAYIAAQLNKDDVDGTFVVGDNETYGGFYNAPLEQGNKYTIWFGAFTDVDGTQRQSFVKTEEPVLVQAVVAESSSNHIPVIVGVLIVFIFLIVAFAILLLIWRKRHLTAEREKAELPSFGPTIIPDPDTAPSTPTDNFEAAPLIARTSGFGYECEPLYGNVGSKVIPIKVEDLWDYIRVNKENDIDGLKKEYKMIPAGLTANCEIAKKPQNKSKNRYGNIIAYDHTRVVLEPLSGDIHDDYINANYIDGYKKPRAYVAAQGPTKPTLNDIWRMVWQENSKTLIMLTNSTEAGKCKCELYWPEEGSQQYGTISVQLVDTETLPDFTIRTFLLMKNDISKYVRQYHYTTWPDHGVPKFGNSLLLFRQKIRAYDSLDNGPVIVHCSAGVGRTGTYIAIDTQLERARMEGILDVHNFVQLMRTQRVNMVQTLEQYVFVYDVLLEALICGDTTSFCDKYPEHFDALSKYDPNIGKSKLEDQFELLRLISSTIERDESTTALRPDNLFKNRCKNIIPEFCAGIVHKFPNEKHPRHDRVLWFLTENKANRCRPFLITQAEECNDYINAVFVNSYQYRDAFIVTQMPLPNTVLDFWRLIYDHKSNCIVMLNEIDDKDETCERYWSLDLAGEQHGPFIVEITAEIKSDPTITVRDFTITNTVNPLETPRVVRQFHFHRWTEGFVIPSSKVALLELLDMVVRWQNQTGNHPVTVHCMNGASRSGLYVAVSCVLQRIRMEKEIDVFQAIKQMRLNRPQLIDSFEQFRFCHEITLDYIASMDTLKTFT